MSNEITKYDVNLDELQRMAKMLAMSGYFEADREPTTAIAQMATKILAGRELGYGPFASVQGIHVIKGKPALSANLMAAAVKAHPRYDYRVRKMENDVVTIEFFEDKESIGFSTFTKADANAAGTQNLGKFPRNMLFARAMSNGVRWYCPDVFYGNAVYTPEELGATVDDSGNVEAQFTVVNDKPVNMATGEIIEPTPVQAQPVAIETPSSNGHTDQPEATPTAVLPTDQIEFAANLAKSFDGPPAAWKWSVDAGYYQNEHPARTCWTRIVKEKGGYSPAKLQEIATEFVKYQLAKNVQEAA